MLDHKSHLKTREVNVAPANIDIAVSESPHCAVVLVLPSAAELKQLRETAKPTFSVRQLSKKPPGDLEIAHQQAFASLMNKFERYKDSVTYLTQLAGFGSLTGRVQEAIGYLRTAVKINSEPFLTYELGAALIDNRQPDEALAMFEKCDLTKDVHANLRVAHLYARKNRVDMAWKYVQQALTIDNVDFASRMFEGAIHLWRRDWEMAIRAFRIAAEENRNSSPLYVNLAAAYWGVGEEDKAIQTLRKACVIDPVNENAVLFLADTMFIKGTPEDCIEPLHRLVQYEQANPIIWAQLARAHYECAKKKGNDHHELLRALDALKKQAALHEDSHVWNNMGVVYSTMHEQPKAKRFYAQAWLTAQKRKEPQDVSLSNLLGVMVELGEHDDVFRLSSEYIKTRAQKDNTSRTECRILLLHVVSMEALGRRDEAAATAERLLEEGVADDEVRIELLTHLFHFRTVIKPDRKVIEKYIPIILEDLERKRDLPKQLRLRALNNLVFTLLQYEQIERARLLLGDLSQWAHKDPYATATLGLFHAKQGNLGRAEGYYLEAISLLTNKETKARFRQRMYIELGKSHLKLGNTSESERYLLKSVNEKLGFESVKEDANRILRALRHDGRSPPLLR